MSVNILYPSSFIETIKGTDCNDESANYVRNQPSRETGGTILTELSEKYMSIPYRESTRLLKSFKLHWGKVPEEDKKKILELVGPLGEEKETQKRSSPQMQMANTAGQGRLENEQLIEILGNIDNPTDAMKQQYTPQELEKMKKDVDALLLEKYWYIFLIIGILAFLVVVLGSIVMSRNKGYKNV